MPETRLSIRVPISSKRLPISSNLRSLDSCRFSRRVRIRSCWSSLSLCIRQNLIPPRETSLEIRLQNIVVNPQCLLKLSDRNAFAVAVEGGDVVGIQQKGHDAVADRAFQTEFLIVGAVRDDDGRNNGVWVLAENGLLDGRVERGIGTAGARVSGLG